MPMHPPGYPVAGHLEHGAGQRIARVRAAPAFATNGQVLIGIIAEDDQGVASVQGAVRDERLGTPLTPRRGIRYLLSYIGAF